MVHDQENGCFALSKFLTMPNEPGRQQRGINGFLTIVCHQVLPSKDEASRCGGWFSVTHIHHSILYYTILYYTILYYN